MSIDGIRAVDKEPLAAVDYLFGMSTVTGQRVGPRPISAMSVAQQITALLPNGTVKTYSSVAAMNADVTPAAGTLAYAEGKTWRKTAASGSPGWELFLDFIPGAQIVRATVTGGTANAVVATSATAVSATPYQQLITVGPFSAANTGAMTVAINGVTRPLVTNTGQPIPAGYVTVGMSALVVVDSDGKLRLYSYGDASAIQAIVEDLLVQAQAARDAAQAAVSSVVPNTFATKAAAQAYSPTVAPDFIRLAGYNASGDNGGGLYKKVGSQPSHAGKFSITLQNASVVWYEIAEKFIDPAMLGAPYGGVSDCRAALATADAVALAVGRSLLISGRMLISSNIDVTSPVTIAKGGMIAPASGVWVYLAGGVQAGMFQVFDYVDRTCRVFTGNREMMAEWWGVSPARPDNSPFLQYAADSCAGYWVDVVVYASAPVIGGVVTVNTDRTHLMRSTVQITGGTVIRGKSRYTTFSVDDANWNTADNRLFRFERTLNQTATITIASPAVVTATAHGRAAGDRVFFTTTGALPTGITSETVYRVSAAGLTTNSFRIETIDTGTPINTSGTQSGTHTLRYGVSQFDCRLEHCRLQLNNSTKVSHGVWASSWNERCGMFDVWVNDVFRNGVTIVHGYGGAATSEIHKVDVWLGAGHSLTAICFNVDLSDYALIGRYNLLMRHVIGLTADSPVSGQPIGLYLVGNVSVTLDGWHPEHINGVWLEGAARLYGNGINGGNLCPQVVQLGPTFDKTQGCVNISADQAGATALLLDGTTGGNNRYSYRTESRFKRGQRLVWPADPNEAFASIAVTGGAGSPTASWASGNISTTVTKSVTGRYTFTLNQAMGSASDYRVRVDPDFLSGSFAIFPNVARNTSTSFDVMFRNSAGTAIDVGDFNVHVLHAL